MTDLEIRWDPRLAHAETPEREWYTSPRGLELEQERIFGRGWQLVGRSDQVERPGQYFTTVLAGEPIIVVRGQDDRLRALSNVCRHRAGPVAIGEGERRSFQCGYHGWTYKLDGCLAHAREIEGVEGFDPGQVHLPEMRAEAWGPLVFVSLDPGCAPLATMLGDLPGELAPYFESKKLVPAAKKEWTIACNWKVYVDNYLEGYHIPIVHPSLNRDLDYDAYRTETKANYSTQIAPMRATAAGRLAPVGQAPGEARYVWIFPNLMLNIYPDNFSTNLILPKSAEETTMVFEWFFERPELPEVQERVRRAVEVSDEIQLEDIDICEAVQRGLRSKTYSRGRYSVARENGVHHFHGLLARHLWG